MSKKISLIPERWHWQSIFTLSLSFSNYFLSLFMCFICGTLKMALITLFLHYICLSSISSLCSCVSAAFWRWRWLYYFYAISVFLLLSALFVLYLFHEIHISLKDSFDIRLILLLYLRNLLIKNFNKSYLYLIHIYVYIFTYYI